MYGMIMLNFKTHFYYELLKNYRDLGQERSQNCNQEFLGKKVEIQSFTPPHSMHTKGGLKR